MSPSTLVIRLGGLADILVGLLYFVGYAGMAELLLPVMSNLGGHVVLGLAGMATLPALVGVLARDTGRSARLGTVGYSLSFIGTAVFSVGNLTEGIFAMELGVVLFGMGVLFAAASIVIASMPRGCIGNDCASLTMLGFNDQNAQALMAMPFGIAWMAVS